MPSTSRPRTVAIGVGLFAGSVAIGALKMLFVPVPGPLWFGVLILVILLALAFAVWSRQNWARILLLVLLLMGLAGTFFVREELLQEGPFFIATMVGQTVMQAAGVIYMFLRASNEWFRKRPSVAPAP